MEEKNRIENRIELPGWDVDAIIEQIKGILETPHMTEVDLNFHDAVDSVPTITYTITRFSHSTK